MSPRNGAPWESRPDVQKLVSAQRAKTTYPARETIGDAIFIFPPSRSRKGVGLAATEKLRARRE